MRVVVWGCRGSVPTPGPLTVRCGGNTSCVEISLDDGSVLVLDAGTGIRPLGVELVRSPPVEVHVLLTHLHLDHLQGLGFFRPLFTPGADIHIWGPASPVQNLSERIAMYLSPPLFPVHLDDVPSRLSFHDAPEHGATIGSATVTAGKVTHQGPTVGYRIEEHGRALVYLPDHEPSLGTELRGLPAAWMSGHGIASGADVLLHDAQYRDDEYGDHVGWGHSSIGDAMQFAYKSEVAQVVLFHHDPYHTDGELDALLAAVHVKYPDMRDRVRLACEGMTIELDPGGVRMRD
jgi:phosphoribosyl 1,2-cyclic phosphodiesterase